VKMAIALAQYENEKLSVTHIELAIKGRQEFKVHVNGKGIAQNSRMVN
jgi:hypothetical protein